MKNDRDATEAAITVTIWLIAFMGGLMIADEYNLAAGLFLSISVTISVIIICYCDWRNDKTKKRLDRYIDDTNERIKEVITIGAEKNFENRIKTFLEGEGAWFIKYWAGSQFTKSGVPDILACVNGYFVAIEVKAPNGKPSELQLHTIEKIRDAGGFAFVLYPSGFDEFKQFIHDLNRETFNRDMEVIMK